MQIVLGFVIHQNFLQIQHWVSVAPI